MSTQRKENFFADTLFGMTVKNDDEMQEYFVERPEHSGGQNENLIKENGDGLNQGGTNAKDNDDSESGGKSKQLEAINKEDGVVEVSVQNKRTFINRVFGRIDAGSIRGSIFSLAIMSLGSACLALPKKFGQMSMLVALIDIVLAGIATYWTLNLMIFASEKYKIYNYSKLVKACYGRGLSLILEITIMIYILGVLILYQLVVNKLLGGAVNEFGGYGYNSIDDFFENSFWAKPYVKFPTIFGTAVFVIMPLCLQNNISKMRITSAFGVLSLLLLVVIILVQTPSYFTNYLDTVYDEKDPTTHLNLFDVTSGFKGDLLFFKGTATLFYAYSCHIGAFPIYNELKNKVLRRVQKVFSRSILLDASFYIVVGIAGYLSNPIGTPDLIIERYKIFNNDYVMTIGWIAFMFTMLMKIPANYNSFRITLLTLLGYDSSNTPTKVNILITIPTITLTCTVASLYNKIEDYISLLGSFCCVIISFLIPCLLYIKANDYPITHYKNIVTITVVSLLCLTGFTSGILTIKGMLK